MSDSYTKLQEYRSSHMDTTVHYFEWENVYKTQSKSELMSEFVQQESENYPWSKGETKDRQRFAALVQEIHERTVEEMPWLRRISRMAKTTAIASLVTLFDKFS